MKKRLITFYPFIIFVGLTLFFSRKFLFTSGQILYGEFFGSVDYFFFLKQFLNAWTDYTSLGHSNIGISTSYGLNPLFFVIPPGYNLPFLSLLSIFQLIFANFSSKMYIILSIFLPFLGMYFLAKFWFKDITKHPFVLNLLSFVASVIYSVSGQMSSRISAGHLRYSLGHAMFPLLLLCTLKGIEEKNPRKGYFYIFVSGLIIAQLVWAMPQLLSLYLILLFFYFLIFIVPDKEKIKKILSFVLASLVIGILLNIHIWLPALFYPEKLAYIETPYYSSSYVNITSKSTKFNELIANGSGSEKAFVGEIQYKTVISYKLLIPFLAIMLFIPAFLVLSKIKRKFLYLFLVAASGIIFSWGINYPFEKIFMYLFSNVFLFKPFRDVGKFAILYLFSLSLFVPYAFFLIYHLFGKKSSIIAVGLFVFFLLYVSPSFTSGNFGNIIVPFQLPDKYEKLNRFLSEEKGNFRVAIYPNDKYIGQYDWFPKNLLPSSYYNVFHILFPLSKNLAVSNRTMTDWSSRYLDYLELNLDQPWTAERLGEEMVRFMIVDHSLPEYEKVLASLDKNPKLKKLNAVSGFTLFEIVDYNKQAVKEKDAVYYFGDVPGVKYLSGKLSLINLNSNQIELLAKNYSPYLLLYNSSLDDVFYTSLDRYKISFFPEVRFPRDSAKDFYFPAEYLRSLTQPGIVFYNPEIIRTEGQGNKIDKNFEFKKGRYKVLLSTASAPGQTNSLKITIDNKSKKMVNFRKKSEGMEWIDFGEVDLKESNVNIAIENLEPGSLYVDYFLLIPFEDYKKLRNEFYSQVNSKKIIEVDKPISQDSIKDNKKAIHVLSQSFSPYWNICNTEVIRVNFYGTGALCDVNATTQPNFKPDKIYKIGIILSGSLYVITIASMILLQLKFNNSFNKSKFQNSNVKSNPKSK